MVMPENPDCIGVFGIAATCKSSGRNARKKCKRMAAAGDPHGSPALAFPMLRF